MAIEIKKCILTKNDCYKAGKKITPRGIMIHSTGANNPYLKRYVQPDDGIIGKNVFNNDWNRPGKKVCVHAFIGKDKNGAVRCYQTLPWDHRGWHCGKSGNDTHISFEICEDNLKDRNYFNQVYNMAVELCAYLCKKYGLKSTDIIDHSEGYKKGIASNHSDVNHWFPKHGKSMATLRADVDKLLKQEDVYRIKIDGQQVIALTGLDKAIAYADQYKNHHVIIEEISTGKIVLDEDRKPKVKPKSIYHRLIVNGKQVNSFADPENALRQGIEELKKMEEGKIEVHKVII